MSSTKGEDQDHGGGGEEGESSTPATVTKDFLGTTSAHGLPHILDEKHLALKILWFLIFLGAMSYFGVQMSSLIREYSSRPVGVRTSIIQR